MAPTVWLLTDDRPGNRTQAVGAARAVGWPFAEKPLVFNDEAKRATPLLGATLKTLDEASRASIAPPWPDLVIGAGRRVAPVARFIKRESQGRARVVLVGRKTPGDFADLVIRCAYFEQAPSPSLLELVLPPTQVDAEALDAAMRDIPDPLAGLARPVCVFLVGGPTARHLFEPDLAEAMARDVAAAAFADGLSLAIVTSPRTPADAIEAMRRGAPDARMHLWRRDAVPNPFLAFLARADRLAVTGESESMLAEAVAARKPLTIYPLPARPLTAKARIRGAIARAALGPGPLGSIGRRIMNEGWVTPRRDLSALHRMIVERGWGEVFDGAINGSAPALFDEGDAIRRRIHALTPRSDRGGS